MKRSALFRYQIISIMICFYVMGAIEMVGIASNYIKVNLHINDAKANLIPSLVYIWFLICTIPVGMLMTKIGRKSTVIISMSLMFIAMFIALFSNSYAFMLICFILLGIGDVSMQTSLYPLLSNVISGKRLAENLTVGQFVKTLSSFSAPYVAMIGSVYFLHFFNLGWRMLFVFYMIFTIIGITMLSFARIERQIESDRAVSFIECFRLLKDKFILFAFLGVMCHVGIDISTNTIAPELLMYRLDIILDKASFAASLYFIARLFGCLFWSFFLNKVSRKIFF